MSSESITQNDLTEILNGVFPVKYPASLISATDAGGAESNVQAILDEMRTVQKTFGTAWGLSANLALTTSDKKIPLINFNGDGCTLVSNGIRVPADGLYEVSGSAYFSTGFTANDIIHLRIYINSTYNMDSVKRMGTASPYEIVNNGVLIKELNAGDMVYLYAYNQTAARGNVGNQANTRLTVNRIA